ncbi:MAG: L,D-transpeptidase family protein [Desulfuromonadaceae bacterium]|nr:L,D-transpeptidase family protein [Desulfuromonadaceae bacterium]
MIGFFSGDLEAAPGLLPVDWSSPIQESISRRELPVRLAEGGRKSFHPSLQTFYEQRGHIPAWLSDDGLSREAETFIEHLRDLSDEGLCPEDYRLAELEELLLVRQAAARSGQTPGHPWWVAMDILLTDAFLTLADDYGQGRVRPRQVHDEWSFAKRTLEPVMALRSALEDHAVEEVLDQLRPLSSSYRKLAEALRRYRDVASRGGWPTIPSGPSLRRGEKDLRIPLLRRRFLITGDLSPGVKTSPDTLDASLLRALIHFQRRHGLAADGVLGPKTLQEMNVSADERVRQIEVNLERWRWLPRNLGERYLQVNIPDMMLTVMEGGDSVLWMPVVVGRAVRETPVFSARMTYIEFSPYWHVPPTILREDKLPKIKKDPRWLTRNNFDLLPLGNYQGGPIDPRRIDWQGVEHQNFPGVLRQRPGPWNPLGRIKFMFPNNHAVYLHDTNQPWLFSHNRRLYSSGCIRIQRPLDLAQYLLEGEGWDCESLIQAMDLDWPRLVWLPKPVPVYLLYQTAWVDNGGLVHFRKDLYHKDLLLDYLLVQRNALNGGKG